MTSKGSNPKLQKKTKPMEELMRLSKTLQFNWFIGHSIVFFSAIWYLFSFNPFFYRLAYVGVTLSFGIITYQQYFLKSIPKTAQTLLHDENILYFVMSIFWLFTPIFSISLLPYLSFSIFHSLKYVTNVLLPTVWKFNAEDKIITVLRNFITDYNEKCMYWVGTTEIITFIILFFKAILFYRRSWILLVVYTLFIKIRYEVSKYSKTAFAQWRVRLDGLISHPSVPIPVKKGYDCFKTNLIKFSNFKITQAAGAEPAATEKKNDHIYIYIYIYNSSLFLSWDLF
ncbi:hypothetical protein KAFR_0F02760 [Kazachstania africana CBS 2517]|uniref:Nucleoporin POM33 n=1 Tax=Kazachstania africana (strain ATCC 22294 / BCRC 22015 / CBS 2517 / CECT 1963 / NBRC 1671 / NRRL Y-8276) TaxID=1071382 RepID=H2AWX3_KAZAF|nr:hypothetical protein KAFR_0F02760 [Kazachstania africana CBS 2517]CCF58873.1 hypothetical protein KAFR_0F02760 [Kazachstania africana CBS 2517]